MRHVFLGIETTGLSAIDGNRIIEIACIEMQDGKLTGDKRHFYVNPGRDSHEEAIKIHGITSEFLGDKPNFSEIAQELLGYLKKAHLVIHHAPFSLGFLRLELGLLGMEPIEQSISSVIDTLVMSNELFPEELNSIDALCERFELNMTIRTLHCAMTDAEMLVEIYVKLTDLLNADNPLKPYSPGTDLTLDPAHSGNDQQQDQVESEAKSRLFIPSIGDEYFEWVEIPLSTLLIDRIAYLHKLEKNSQLSQVEIQIAAAWKVPEGWKAVSLTFLRIQSGLVSIHSFIEPADKSRTDLYCTETKVISTVVWPFDSSVVSMLQKNVDGRSDYIDATFALGHMLNNIFFLSASERRFLFECGCIDSLDAEVADWDLEHWRPQAEAHIVRRIDEYLKATDQPLLRPSPFL